MNNISNQIEQLNQEQMRLYQEMTKLISEACKKRFTLGRRNFKEI